MEYVVATHADRDHIAAFVGTTDFKGIFESFQCDTIIDFPRTNKVEENDGIMPELLGEYYEKRDAEIALGADHYTALECWNQINGAQRSYTLSENISMNVLYNYYYENKATKENDYSVCLLFKQGDYNYIFTGDLEKNGETKLIDYNELPHCKLYKGGHHGSSTSSNEDFLAVISPELVCVCTCCGSPEFSKDPAIVFPSQEFVDRVGIYTDQIYVTTLATGINLAEKKWEGFTSMNGDITVTSNGINLTVTCSNNNTILKETAWFKENRVWPTVS